MPLCLRMEAGNLDIFSSVTVIFESKRPIAPTGRRSSTASATESFTESTLERVRERQVHEHGLQREKVGGSGRHSRDCRGGTVCTVGVTNIRNPGRSESDQPKGSEVPKKGKTGRRYFS